jgi:hypothetical protein
MCRPIPARDWGDLAPSKNLANVSSSSMRENPHDFAGQGGDWSRTFADVTRAAASISSDLPRLRSLVNVSAAAQPKTR